MVPALHVAESIRSLLSVALAPWTWDDRLALGARQNPKFRRASLTQSTEVSPWQLP